MKLLRKLIMCLLVVMTIAGCSSEQKEKKPEVKVLDKLPDVALNGNKLDIQKMKVQNLIDMGYKVTTMDASLATGKTRPVYGENFDFTLPADNFSDIFEISDKDGNMVAKITIYNDSKEGLKLENCGVSDMVFTNLHKDINPDPKLTIGGKNMYHMDTEIAKEEFKDFNYMDSTGTSKYFYTKLGNEQIEIYINNVGPEKMISQVKLSKPIAKDYSE